MAEYGVNGKKRYVHYIENCGKAGELQATAVLSGRIH